MGECYVRLSLEEREEISRELSMGWSLRAISRSLGRPASTVSREMARVSRGEVVLYRAVRGDRVARKNAQSRRFGKRKLLCREELARLVHQKLRRYWSPQQVAQWLKQEYTHPKMHVSAETIYAYLYVLPRGELKRELLHTLRREHRRRYQRSHKTRKGMRTDLLEMREQFRGHAT